MIDSGSLDIKIYHFIIACIYSFNKIIIALDPITINVLANIVPPIDWVLLQPDDEKFFC
jgi:hypothetical protein